MKLAGNGTPGCVKMSVVIHPNKHTEAIEREISNKIGAKLLKHIYDLSTAFETRHHGLKPITGSFLMTKSVKAFRRDCLNGFGGILDEDLLRSCEAFYAETIVELDKNMRPIWRHNRAPRTFE